MFVFTEQVSSAVTRLSSCCNVLDPIRSQPVKFLATSVQFKTFVFRALKCASKAETIRTVFDALKPGIQLIYWTIKDKIEFSVRSYVCSVICAC